MPSSRGWCLRRSAASDEKITGHVCHRELASDRPMASKDSIHQPRPHILLAVSGSVAAVKVPLLVEQLLRLGEVRVVATSSARHFFDPSVALPTGVELLEDRDEWSSWKTASWVRGSPPPFGRRNAPPVNPAALPSSSPAAAR